jgi:signal peptidase I
MEPSLKFGDSAYLYKWQSPSDFPVGEIVLVKRESGYLLARILGRPGDRIQLENKTLIRNGEVIPPELYPIQHTDKRPALPADFTPRDTMAEIRVPEGHFFLLSDNRDEAMDSRFIGSIPIDRIIGRFSP